MSHEIRTPMTAILGYADLLMDPTLGPSGRNNYLAVIRRNGEHLLDADQRHSRSVEDRSREDVVEDVAVQHRLAVGRRGEHGAAAREPRDVSLTVEYPGEVPETILTDGGHVRQAVMNLVGNAVKFTQRGACGSSRRSCRSGARSSPR